MYNICRAFTLYNDSALPGNTEALTIKIPCQLSPAGLIRIFTCKGLQALSAELHHALVPEEVHL